MSYNFITKMSLHFNVHSLSIETRELISSELKVDVNADADKSKKYFKKAYKPKKWVYPYRVCNDIVYLPLAWALKNIPGSQRKTRKTYCQSSYDYTANLRPHQKEIRREALSCLNKRGTVVISAYPGFGKTVTSIGLAHKIGMRTLVLVNKVILKNQWVECVVQFTNLKKGVGVVKAEPATKSQRENASKLKKWEKKIKDASIVVMNALTVKKMPSNFFSDVGCLIVDECHQIMSECLSEALLYVHPRYVIALSATPYRSDGLNNLLTFYFSEEHLVRELKRSHTVYEIRTGFKPIADITDNGRLDWNGLLNSQSENEERNKMILDTVSSLSESRTILILTKRVDHASYLESELKKMSVSVSGLYGTKKSFDKAASVLIGTSSKIGVGFDHKRLDCLVLASDVESYFIQFLGRVFRREDVEPIILDFVDTNPVLRKHFRTRKSVYVKHGGNVITVKNSKSVLSLINKHSM